jgi:hypothetical protein
VLLSATPALTLATLHLLTHPEGRLAGAAIVTLLIVLLYVGGAMREVRRSPRIATSLAAIECAALVVMTVLALGRVVSRVSLDRGVVAQSPAQRFAQLGLRPGSRVGVIGSPFGQYWAHQAGVRIAVTIDDDALAAMPGESERTAIAAEACARGYPIEGIAAWSPSEARAEGMTPVGGGLTYWAVREPCSVSAQSTAF